MSTSEIGYYVAFSSMLVLVLCAVVFPSAALISLGVMFVGLFIWAFGSDQYDPYETRTVKKSKPRTKRPKATRKSIKSDEPCVFCGGEVREWSGEMICYTCNRKQEKQKHLLGESPLLRLCPVCKGKVSARASSCPHCGEPNPTNP